MVTDQYLNRREEWEKVKGVFAIISEKPEIVADWLTEKILKNDKKFVRFIYGGMPQDLSRLITNIFKRKRIIDHFTSLRDSKMD